MSKTTSKKRKLFYGILLFILIVLLISSTFLFLSTWEKGIGLFPAHNETNKPVKIDGINYVMNENVQGILLMGLDKFENETDDSGFYNDQQADFLMLFVLDTENHTYSAVHLNRDTMANINVLGVAGEKLDTIYAQLALAHTYGNGKEVSCRNTADAVSDMFNNISIDKYISITMDAVPVITDLVGGVEVEIKDDFSNIDSSLKSGETVTLNGQQSLNFVRSRYGLEDSSNSARMVRQQDYIRSLFEAFNAKAESDDDFVTKASLELSDYIVSNYSIHQLSNLITNISDYEFVDIYDIDGEYKTGEKFLEFYPRQENINELLINLFYIPESTK